MRFRFVLPTLFVGLVGAHFAVVRANATERAPNLPPWLAAHVGDGSDQIAPTVLERARALYRQKASAGVVRNPCYFAMDATRPNDRGDKGARFYTICEDQHVFRAIPAGHGGGRNLAGAADFANGMRCAKNFGNALDSELTAGGPYVTAETKRSFKGYYRAANGQSVAFSRTFLQFDGEGETATARPRAIGGHAAETLKGVCLRQDQSSPYADSRGLVPFGKLVEYTGGRSNGCTSWSPEDAEQILDMVKDRPTTLYIYPARSDVDAVARAVGAGQSLSHAGLYWNATCLKTVGAPHYWSRDKLEPIIARYRAEHPAPPPQPTPLCAGQ